MPNPYFKFKQFTVYHDQCAMKVGTDGVLLGTWAGQKTSVKRVLDIGAGTGLISLMLAQRFEQANVSAVEIESSCANQCDDNFKSSPFSTRSEVFNQSIQTFAERIDRPFDLIVSNPPFFVDAYTSEDDTRNLARHNHTLRQHDLWQAASQCADNQSVFAVILPLREAELFIEKSKDYPWHLSRKCNVRGTVDSKVKRLLLEFKQIPPAQVIKEELVLEKSRGVYTEDFTQLAKDFYLNL